GWEQGLAARPWCALEMSPRRGSRRVSARGCHPEPILRPRCARIQAAAASTYSPPFPRRPAFPWSRHPGLQTLEVHKITEADRQIRQDRPRVSLGLLHAGGTSSVWLRRAVLDGAPLLLRSPLGASG